MRDNNGDCSFRLGIKRGPSEKGPLTRYVKISRPWLVGNSGISSGWLTGLVIVGGMVACERGTGGGKRAPLQLLA